MYDVSQKILVDPSKHMKRNLLYQSIIFSSKPSWAITTWRGTGIAQKFITIWRRCATNPGRVRRTYVTLDRAFRFGKTVGCKGCDRMQKVWSIPKLVMKDSGLCWKKKRVKSKKKLLNLLKPNRRQGKGSLQRSKPKSTATFSNPKLSHPCLPVKPQCLAMKNQNDIGSLIKKREHGVRFMLDPRKRLLAPVGNDCPFNAKDIGSKRITEWRCRNRVSTHQDDWQVNPYQRICSRSWTGPYMVFPIRQVGWKACHNPSSSCKCKEPKVPLKEESRQLSSWWRELNRSKESLHAMLSQLT